ncbi:ribbon-helix-helix domain-containing protein [[Limnothrix rosea] IAM M-220]|uniref:ribbon-helix-helix domain-containing protein n=1 Tax=[Limnothrix rosea] IAM M-220 TaxID=454133 RepID=UPI002685B183|nr:hypothetical protein [[Limnothrix rosea] IAM M-220]
MSETMSKRFQVTLPDAVYAELEAKAKNEGRPVANLAAFLIEASIKKLEPKESDN